MAARSYARLLHLARRYAPTEGLASDLLHDALLVAAQKGVDPDDEARRRRLTGVLRNTARHQVRTDGRRRRREDAAAPGRSAQDADLWDVDPSHGDPNAGETWDRLPPSARRVVMPALHGLGKEICAVLDVSDAAFRQRLMAARRALGALPDDLQREAIALASARRQERGDALGLVRGALLRRLRPKAEVGTVDPDGHLVIVGETNP